MNLFTQYIETFVTKELLSTIVVLFGATFILFISSFYINKQEWSKIKSKQYLSVIRNATIIFTLFFLFFIWKGEIRAFLLSISALTVGIFVAFRDVILSFFSYFVISSNQLFKIGDVVEIDNKVGKVIDKTLLYTKISLTGVEHSKELVVPNNYFASGKFINLSSNIRFSKVFSITTENKNIKNKINDMHNIVKENIENTFITYDIILESDGASNVVIKIIFKGIEDGFDFNLLKNSIFIDYNDRYPFENTLDKLLISK